jgi:protein-tyrosine phosphatase
MAAAFLQRRLAVHEPDVEVTSAGFGAAGFPATTRTIQVMDRAGFDLRDHRSRRVGPADLEAADLAIGMTRRHVMDLALLDPAAWPRIFSLVDLVERGREVGPRWGSETATAWVAGAHAARDRPSVATVSAHSDIADPAGRRRAAHVRTRDRLDRLTSELAQLLATPTNRVDRPG